ncbi:o-succinylbenzoate synthase [Carboxylicivirga sp. A043]|uniref:o-succinylbenzoate synthase n=1 Tax=Carboxylicivirga litoralis TaxID=2816963 RepID=UPI0021CB0D79|nr:o-succinylbenzoate synthase [Carboxylicivirga sp. A043]MCU4156942.1 o-succinylbenzoate synthase [Carboxylicivirga sp. A043]
MHKAEFVKRELEFKEAGGTSRGVLYTKPSWFIKITNEEGCSGIGECSIIPSLSLDDAPDLEDKIEEVCKNIDAYLLDFHSSLVAYPALRFAIEMALLDLSNKRPFHLFDSSFVKGDDSITINGLIWMGEAEEMLRRITHKLQSGFKCLKLKVGAIDFEQELSLLTTIRQHYSADDLEIRVDANGAFAAGEVEEKLQRLANFQIHSIEQPIKAGQIEEMHHTCQTSPIPIALDEELIGVSDYNDKKLLLESIKPQYIILKPSLLGGFSASDEWIELAEKLNVQWWATSALEANVGLNAIAQWVFTKNNPLRQGLGTGQVFTNNIESPLYLSGEKLFYQPKGVWENPFV